MSVLFVLNIIVFEMIFVTLALQTPRLFFV